MSAPARPVGEALADYAGGPDLVMACRCGKPMQPAEMFRIPSGPGNAAVTRIGCPVCYWAAAGPYTGGPS